MTAETDLISRQDAIDVAKEWIDAVYFEENDKRERKAIECFIGSLKNIPSAQQWIPCSERLPEALQEVLVTSTHGHVYTSRIVHGDFEYGGNVLAWMPLPEPYKGEES